jgi:hypothetical protein
VSDDHRFDRAPAAGEGLQADLQGSRASAKKLLDFGATVMKKVTGLIPTRSKSFKEVREAQKFCFAGQWGVFARTSCTCPGA